MRITDIYSNKMRDRKNADRNKTQNEHSVCHFAVIFNIDKKSKPKKSDRRKREAGVMEKKVDVNHLSIITNKTPVTIRGFVD